MSPIHQNRHVRLVSFSGIDGAGKSTQIEIFVAGWKRLGCGFS